MKIYQEHAYSSSDYQNYQCRAIRGDGTVFWVHIVRSAHVLTGDNTTIFIGLMDDYGQTCRRELLKTEVKTVDSKLRLLNFSPAASTSRERAPWKTVAHLDALDILKPIAKNVAMNERSLADETAHGYFRFKKRGARTGYAR